MQSHKVSYIPVNTFIICIPLGRRCTDVIQMFCVCWNDSLKIRATYNNVLSAIDNLLLINEMMR